MTKKDTVLLVEDSESTQMIVSAALRSVCNLVTCGSGQECLNLLQHQNFALILLDIELPDTDGFQLYDQIRQDKRLLRTPIMFLTGKTETEDRVRGYSLGAEDYIVKPIDPIVFKARIDSKLKNLSAQYEASTHFELGPFKIDVPSQAVFMETSESPEPIRLSLTANQFKILFYLLKNEGETVSRAELLDEAWGKGVHITNRTIDTHVYSIRQKLGLHASVLQSVHGEGYKLSLRGIRTRKVS